MTYSKLKVVIMLIYGILAFSCDSNQTKLKCNEKLTQYLSVMNDVFYNYNKGKDVEKNPYLINFDDYYSKFTTDLDSIRTDFELNSEKREYRCIKRSFGRLIAYEVTYFNTRKQISENILTLKRELVSFKQLNDELEKYVKESQNAIDMLDYYAEFQKKADQLSQRIKVQDNIIKSSISNYYNSNNQFINLIDSINQYTKSLGISKKIEFQSFLNDSTDFLNVIINDYEGIPSVLKTIQ